MQFFNGIGKKVNKVVRSVSDKSGADAARITKEISDLGVQVEQLFTAFGRACFADHTGEGDTAVTQELCQKIADNQARTVALKKELDTLNGVRRCPECGEVLPITARFCSACGVRQPEEEAKPAEPAPAETRSVEYCPNCGAAREGEAEVCAVCGKPFGGEESAPEPEAEAALRVEIDTEEPAAEVIEEAAEEVEEAAEEVAAVDEAIEEAVEEAAEEAVEEAAEEIEEAVEDAEE